MLKVDDKLLIKDYKQYKKDIKLIKVLLDNYGARYRWCKKRNLNIMTDEELQRDLKNYKSDLELLERYIVR